MDIGNQLLCVLRTEHLIILELECKDHRKSPTIRRMRAATAMMTQTKVRATLMHNVSLVIEYSKILVLDVTTFMALTWFSSIHCPYTHQKEHKYIEV